MRGPCWKVPDVAFLDVVHIGLPQLIERCRPHATLRDVSPLGSKMPMKLPNAARSKSHVDAGDRRRNREIRDRDLPGPAAALNALGCNVERGPEPRHAAYVGCGRVFERRELIRDRRILW